jgi:hypothetical protein
MSSRIRILSLTALSVAALSLAACNAASSSGAPASAAPSAAASAPAASAAASMSPAASASASAAASTGAATGDLEALVPATVGDVTMSATETDGETYVIANVNRQLGPILTALGKTPADVQVVSATGSAAGGATLFIDVVRVNGADATALLDAFQTAASAAPGAQVETSDVGGRQVVTVTNPSYTLAVTATGDTLIYIQSPDAELVTTAVEALPTAA